MQDTTERLLVLGVSAGGHEALMQVLESVGRNSPHAFVVASKTSSEGPSMLEEMLQARTLMRVVTVESRTPLSSGTVYLPPPGRMLLVSESTVRSAPRSASALDEVLSSAAATWGARVTAVMLGGAPAEVVVGVRALMDAGGSVYCQSPAQHSEETLATTVLRHVGATGVGTPEEMATWIRSGLGPAVRDTGDPEQLDVPLPHAFWTLLEQLRRSLGVDLYSYRTATFYRRASQRARALGCPSIESYVERALSDPCELELLESRLLIGTTAFFRNPALFEDLRRVVVPAVRDRAALSVWCAGCSSGEEAYSVAALLHAELEAIGSQTRLRIVGTDARAAAIAQATAGVYDLERLENVPPGLRDRYGVREGDRWRVGDELRESVFFSVHDVLSDPPPTDCDLVLFRNVMIYLRPEVHPRALARMHQALRPGGFLAVGESESTHSAEGGFRRVVGQKGSLLQRI